MEPWYMLLGCVPACLPRQGWWTTFAFNLNLNLQTFMYILYL